jgi:hypothetical protein
MEKVKASGISVRFITGMGEPAEGIIDVAENEHVDSENQRKRRNMLLVN